MTSPQDDAVIAREQDDQVRRTQVATENVMASMAFKCNCEACRINPTTDKAVVSQIIDRERSLKRDEPGVTP
jgi:hypothetical protein